MKNLFVLTWVSVGLGLAGHAAAKINFGLDQEHVPGQLIVKFKDGIPTEFQTQVVKKLKLGQKNNLANDKSQVAVLDFPSVNSNSSLGDVAKSLNALPEVEYVEPNFIYRINETIPDDLTFPACMACIM